MLSNKAWQRQRILGRVAFWLRACNDDDAVGSERVLRRYINNAREAMDELMLDMFGDKQDGEAESVSVGTQG